MDTAEIILVTSLVILLATVAALRTVPWALEKRDEWRAQPRITERLRVWVGDHKPSV